MTHNACSYRVVYLVQACCAGSLALCTPPCLPIMSRGLEVSLHSLVLCLLLFLQLLGQLLSSIPATASQRRFCKSINAHVHARWSKHNLAIMHAWKSSHQSSYEKCKICFAVSIDCAEVKPMRHCRRSLQSYCDDESYPLQCTSLTSISCSSVLAKQLHLAWMASSTSAFSCLTSAFVSCNSCCSLAALSSASFLHKQCLLSGEGAEL